MKIGITTHYRESKNYGALLQAYALPYVLNKFEGCHSEQICVQIGYSQKSTIRSKLKKALNPMFVAGYISAKIEAKISKIRTRPLLDNLAIRNAAFSHFEKSIPHSSQKFTQDNITDCGACYDLLITGSDQVWNYMWYNPAFFLCFSDTRKISYAASIGHSSLPNEWEKKFREHLQDFSAISVREENAVAMLQSISPVPVEWVLDPTLLLSSSDWDEICASRQIEDPYIFCYFLGGNKRDRKIAEDVAKRKNLKIVTLPHLLGAFRSADKHFGDYQLWDVGPKEFISLIKYADFVLTDSFHGSVLSIIYRCPFAVFEREGSKGMSGRIVSLTDLTNTQNRFLSTPKMTTADYICSLSIDLPPETDELVKMRCKSINFLKMNLDV